MSKKVNNYNFKFFDINSSNTPLISLLNSNINWIVYRCTKIISDACLIPFTTQDSKLEKVLLRPNPALTYDELIKLSIILYVLDGAVYWYLLRDSKGVVYEIYPLPKGSLIPYMNKNGFIEYYSFAIDNHQRVNKKNVIEFKNIWKHGEGKGILEVVAENLGIYKSSKEFIANFVENFGMLAGYLKTDKKISSKEAKTIQKIWQDSFSGKKNAGKVAVVWDNFEYKELSSQPLSSEFLKTVEFIRDEIISTFGIPKTLLGFTEGINRATAEQQHENFLKFTIKPILNTFESKIKAYLDETFSFDEIIKQKVDEKLKVAELLAKYGAITINELREMFGLKKLDLDQEGNKLITEVVQDVETLIKALKEV